MGVSVTFRLGRGKPKPKPRPKRGKGMTIEWVDRPSRNPEPSGEHWHVWEVPAQGEAQRLADWLGTPEQFRNALQDRDRGPGA